MLYYLSIFLPLLGCVVARISSWLFSANRANPLITTVFVGLSCLCSFWVFFEVALKGRVCVISLYQWIEVSSLNVSWTLNFDTLSTLMIVIVNLVSFLVHVYSIGYMRKDPDIARFMSYLSLFTFMMLTLVSAANMLQLFLGWEGVGLASYLLIGFWHRKESACAAAMKAFIVNRVGDLSLILGMGLLFFTFNTLDIAAILSQVATFAEATFAIGGMTFRLLEVAAFFLFIGAMGKSAQLGLHVWLPDAMEGPTPVSALIHAATMVTAGIYLVCRMSGLYELAPYTKSFMMVIGATTALFAGIIAVTQHDIKRVIAYSTCSQLGYMFFATGAGAYSAAMFHLVTHAFFKALLFLGAGSVIHALSDEQDMRSMGGIWKQIPFTYGLMWIGTLALTGMPVFAGYYSKELILSSTWIETSFAARYAFITGIGATFLTAFYSLRLLLVTFHGAPRASEMVMGRIHESPASMILPMIALAGGSVFGGIVPYRLGWFQDQAAAFWGHALSIPIAAEELAAVPHMVSITTKFFSVSGLILAIACYGYFKEIPVYCARLARGGYWFFYNKGYIDELYQRLWVEPIMNLGHVLWQTGDKGLIDKYGPNGIAVVVQTLAHRARKIQTGYLFHYALAMVSGVAFTLLIYMMYR